MLLNDKILASKNQVTKYLTNKYFQDNRISLKKSVISDEFALCFLVFNLNLINKYQMLFLVDLKNLIALLQLYT